MGIVGDGGGAEADAGKLLLTTGALALAMQVVNWLRVRQHFLYSDLVHR